MNFCRRFAVLVLVGVMAPGLFAATMDARVRRVPADIQAQVFVTPEETLPAVVRNLTNGVSGILEKAKILHDWICDNIAYDTDIYDNPQLYHKQDYESVLKKKAGICSGYTNLMVTMCRLAGIEAQGVTGWQKVFGYDGSLGERPDHAWTAVHVGSRWQLVDVTYDAGYVDWGVYIKHYSTEWLWRAPEQFIYSHLPEEDKWQLLPEKDVWTAERFVDEPYLRGRFFDYGLSLLKEGRPHAVNAIDKPTSYLFQISKASTRVQGQLYTDGGSLVTGAAWSERMGNRLSALFDVPDKTAYKARLLAYTDGALRTPDHLWAADFERNVLPPARQLLADKKITEAELAYFEDSYFKVEANGSYYLREDLFDTPRNNAVTKVLKLIERNTNQYEEVIIFTVQASDDYEGYGDLLRRYPSPYNNYTRLTGTHLVEPLDGVLKKGETYRFAYESRDFSNFALLVDDELNPFTRNPKTGAYELEWHIPEDFAAERLPVYATNNGRNYQTVWLYFVQ